MSSKEENFKLFCELRGQEVEYRVNTICSAWKKGTLSEWYDNQVYCFGFQETDLLTDEIRPIKKPTWREALKEKLKDYPDHFALVCERMGAEKFGKEFGEWKLWTLEEYSFNFNETKEGWVFWIEFHAFLRGDRNDLPPLPKKERYLTAQELKGKWLYDPYEKEVFMVTRVKNDKVYVRNWDKAESSCFVSVETLHKKGFKLEDGSPLLVEDNEGGE